MSFILDQIDHHFRDRDDCPIIFIERIEKDADVLMKKFNITEKGFVVNHLSTDFSDSHKKGRRVFCVEFVSGDKILYKPRSLQNEIKLQEITNYFYRICNLGSYEYSILDKEMYGWCEIVIQRDCKSIEELSRYYQRIGIILFINYLLEGGDIHFENLIACNEYPVIIDAETFIGNIEENNGKSAAEKVASLLRKSVLYSGILPFYSWNNAGDTGINMSAISGEEGQKFPIKIPFIINPKSVNMRVVYDYPVSKGNHNLAMLKGRFIQPSEFADKIIQGFESAYLGAMENTETLLRIIQQYGELEVRYLIRNTQQYAIVLSSSYHPELLVDGGARNLFFYSLANGNLQNQRSRSLIEYEIEDLLSGDIPYFYFRGSKKNIYTWDGREVKDFFSKPALQQIEENIQNLSYKNLEQQTQYIKITFNMENAGTRKIKNKRLKLDLYSNMAKTAEELAKELLDKIGTNAIYSEDGADVNWIGVKLFGIKENQWMIQALPNTLYDGTVGINLVFHLYEWIYHDRKYHKICEVLDNRLLRYIDTISEGEQNIEDFNTGIFSGEGSILYTLGILYEIYDDIKYKEYFDKWLNCMETLILEDRLFDMISGNSGIVLVLINMYRKTKKPSSKQERKITDIIKCYGTTKSIKEVELKNMKPEDNVTVSRYIERNVGSIINKDYVIEGFLGMGKLSDCKDEMVSRLDISKRYCLEILVAFLQEADIIILHEMFENVWNHTIEEILVEFSLRGAVVVFSEHGEESLMKLPMHSYDLSGRCVGW